MSHSNLLNSSIMTSIKNNKSKLENESKNIVDSKAQDNKITPARRLAARQTLKLAIPKFRNIDSKFGNSNKQQQEQEQGSSTAPIMMTNISNGSERSGNCDTSGCDENRTLNEIMENSIQSATENLDNSKFTLNSADVRNNNDIFAFAKTEVSQPEQISKYTHNLPRI